MPTKSDMPFLLSLPSDEEQIFTCYSYRNMCPIEPDGNVPQCSLMIFQVPAEFYAI